MLTRLTLSLVWLLHFLPLGLLAPLGKGVGMLFYVLGRERRFVARTNLSKCFPQLPANEIEKLTRQHFRAFGRSVLEHGILWWGSKQRVQKLVRIEGLEHWQSVQDKPVIWLALHFVGLDMGGIRLATEKPFIAFYTQQKDRVFDQFLINTRLRFEKLILFSRQDGIKPVIRTLKQGFPLYYFPDMDYGERDSIFIPFFNVPAATITGLSRLARITGAAVVPAITRQLPGAQGYVLKFYPPWENFPGPDIETDTRRMNIFIEQRVLEMPEQYFWLHKRFKTRPPGEKKFY